jgi:hypothetical protein
MGGVLECLVLRPMTRIIRRNPWFHSEVSLYPDEWVF